jgi:hypothetical protein
MLAFWIVSGVLYYLIGWIAFVGMYKKLYREDWETGAGIATFFALWIVWFIALYVRQYLENEREKADTYEIKVDTAKISDMEGIVFKYSHYMGGQFAYYNFATEGYAGYIKIDVRKVDTTTIKKIVKLLTDWGEKEKEKNAYIKAYSDVNNRL